MRNAAQFEAQAGPAGTRPTKRKDAPGSSELESDPGTGSSLFCLWLFCAPILHRVPSPPQQDAQRMNSSEVLRLWNGGMLDLLFARVDAHCFLGTRSPGAAQVETFRSISGWAGTARV